MSAEMAGRELGDVAIDFGAGGNDDLAILKNIGGYAAAEGLALFGQGTRQLIENANTNKGAFAERSREEAGQGARCRSSGSDAEARVVKSGMPVRRLRCPRRFRRRRFGELAVCLESRRWSAERRSGCLLHGMGGGRFGNGGLLLSGDDGVVWRRIGGSLVRAGLALRPEPRERLVANAKKAHARIGRFIQILPVFEAGGVPLVCLDPACAKMFCGAMRENLFRAEVAKLMLACGRYPVRHERPCRVPCASTNQER